MDGGLYGGIDGGIDGGTDGEVDGGLDGGVDEGWMEGQMEDLLGRRTEEGEKWTTEVEFWQDSLPLVFREVETLRNKQQHRVKTPRCCPWQRG